MRKWTSGLLFGLQLSEMTSLHPNHILFIPEVPYRSRRCQNGNQGVSRRQTHFGAQHFGFQKFELTSEATSLGLLTNRLAKPELRLGSWLALAGRTRPRRASRRMFFYLGNTSLQHIFWHCDIPVSELLHFGIVSFLVQCRGIDGNAVALVPHLVLRDCLYSGPFWSVLVRSGPFWSFWSCCTSQKSCQLAPGARSGRCSVTDL